MKNIIISMALAAVAATTAPMVAAAEYDYYEENYPGVRTGWGLRASFDINCPGKWKSGDTSVKMFKNGVGLSAGAVYTVAFGPGLFFQPGISLFYDTYKYDDLVIGTENNSQSIDPAVKIFGVRIPAVFGYSFDLWNRASLAFYTGPELNVGIVGRVDIDDNAVWGENPPTNLYKEYNHNRIDCAWKVGAGLPMGNYYVGIEAAFGLCDMLKVDNVSFHENRVSVTLGYNF